MTQLQSMGKSRPTKKRKLLVSHTVDRFQKVDYISALPDEILGNILSLLTLRDSVRTRSLSKRWRYLCDCRSVLVFDALNMFGRKNARRKSNQLKFVRAVDQYIDYWLGWKLSGVEINFCLDNEHASHVNWWFWKIKFTLDCFEYQLFTYKWDEPIRFCEPFIFKCLRLSLCGLTLSQDMSEIRLISTLELAHVRLEKTVVDYILSGGLNLTSLSLKRCCKPRLCSLNVQLPRLKKLFLEDHFRKIELNCPNLEILHCIGSVQHFKFSQVPLLREANLSLNFHPHGFPLTFDGLTKQAPQLQVLSLTVTNEVQLLPANNIVSYLKRLELRADLPLGFDLFTITYLLKATPFLETLYLSWSWRSDTAKQSPQREYSDCPHYRLKEVEIGTTIREWVEMALVRYLLKNAVALQRMVIKENDDSSMPTQMAPNLLQGINTSAELIFL